MPCACHACFDHVTDYFSCVDRGVSETCVARPLVREWVSSMITNFFKRKDIQPDSNNNENENSPEPERSSDNRSCIVLLTSS